VCVCVCVCACACVYIVSEFIHISHSTFKRVEQKTLCYYLFTVSHFSIYTRSVIAACTSNELKNIRHQTIIERCRLNQTRRQRHLDVESSSLPLTRVKTPRTHFAVSTDRGQSTRFQLSGLDSFGGLKFPVLKLSYCCDSHLSAVGLRDTMINYRSSLTRSRVSLSQTPNFTI